MMFYRFSLSLFVILCMSLSHSAAKAQYWGGGGYHASTAAEGYQRGMAEVIRSEGERNLLDAKAASEFEDARYKNIQNRVEATQAYYDRKRIHDEYMAPKRAEAKARVQRYRERRGLVNVSEFQGVDESSGQINWPGLLRGSEFDKYRNAFDAFAKTRADTGSLTGEQFREANTMSREWRKQLAETRDNYQVDQVRDAIRFILALNKELTSS